MWLCYTLHCSANLVNGSEVHARLQANMRSLTMYRQRGLVHLMDNHQCDIAVPRNAAEYINCLRGQVKRLRMLHVHTQLLFLTSEFVLSITTEQHKTVLCTLCSRFVWFHTVYFLFSLRSPLILLLWR